MLLMFACVSARALSILVLVRVPMCVLYLCPLYVSLIIESALYSCLLGVYILVLVCVPICVLYLCPLYVSLRIESAPYSCLLGFRVQGLGIVNVSFMCP